MLPGESTAWVGLVPLRFRGFEHSQLKPCGADLRVRPEGTQTPLHTSPRRYLFFDRNRNGVEIRPRALCPGQCRRSPCFAPAPF
jgi:hypothetical protein